jgi:hypothetical protein
MGTRLNGQRGVKLQCIAGRASGRLLSHSQRLDASWVHVLSWTAETTRRRYDAKEYRSEHYLLTHPHFQTLVRKVPYRLPAINHRDITIEGMSACCDFLTRLASLVPHPWPAKSGRLLFYHDYTVACICPMASSWLPVATILDEIYGSLPTSRDYNAYTMRRLADTT